MKKYLLGLLLALALAQPALAQNDVPTNPGGSGFVWERLRSVIGTNTYSQGTNERSMTQYIGLVISVILGLFGVIFVVLIILAGYHWMTAYGSKEKVSRASLTLTSAVIGLLITIAVYAIWQFLFFRLILTR